MNNDPINPHFQIIQRQIKTLQELDPHAWQEMDAAFEDLQVIYEEIQTKLDAIGVVKEDLLQQNQQLTERYQHYLSLFQASPIAYILTDIDGVILEANDAIAQLLNVPQPYLVGKPFFLYVMESDRSSLYHKLNQLGQSSGTQVWQMHLCPRKQEPFLSEWHINLAYNANGLIKALRIAVYNLSQA